jgi:hypothetical protein
MSQTMSNLLAAWLIATASVGAIVLLHDTVQDAEAIGRVDPAKPVSARPALQQRFPPELDDGSQRGD